MSEGVLVNPQQALQNTIFSNHVDKLPTYNPTPLICGTIRQHCEDFQVTEYLSFEPSGEGEHLFLFIEKQACNSQWVADELQKYFKLRSQDIGYAGKKDRYSISRQWFSLHLPGKENEVEQTQIDALNNSSFKILKVTRHNKKLRKGVIQHNSFKLKVSNLSGKINQHTIENIIHKGFPNYFGYQRFGHNGDNLLKAQQLLSNQIRVRSRNKKGIYLSAARSYLFNLIVAERIKQNVWDHILAGDCLSLSGSQSFFVCEKVDELTEQRLNAGDLSISGWLAGRADSEAINEAAKLEESIISTHSDWITGLVKEGVVSARRAMRVIPQNFQIKIIDDKNLVIEFSLPSGSFATSLLREILIVKDNALNQSVSNEEVVL